MTKDKKTEQRIIEAATTEFLEKGWAGARMQEIANKAKINKAMLHYYFGNKRMLFAQIFYLKLGDFIKPLLESIMEEVSLENKIRIFVERQTAFIIANHTLPVFVISEIWNHPELLDSLPENPVAPVMQHFEQSIQKEVEARQIKDIKIQDFMINMISLVIYPLLARPVFKRFFSLDDEGYKTFIMERKEQVIALLLNSIKTSS